MGTIFEDLDDHEGYAARRSAEDQWEHAHARPLLAAAVPARDTELVDNLREEVAELADRLEALSRRGPRTLAVADQGAHNADRRPPTQCF